MAMYPKYQGSVDNMSNNPYKYFINNHLMNGKKPVKPGDCVHLTTWEGMFRVYGVDAMFFVIKKNGAFYRIPWEHMKCIAGVPGSSTYSKTLNALEELIRTAKSSITEIKKGRYMHKHRPHEYTQIDGEPVWIHSRRFL